MGEVQRSHEWQRMKASGTLRIKDEPGVITVSGKPPFALTPPFLVGVAIAFFVSVFTFAAFHVLGWIWVLWGPALLVVLMIFNSQSHFGGMAYKVRFTPDEIEFFGVNGRCIGQIPREAMKQIAIERKEVSKEHHVFIHVFYGDAAFICALPQGGERMALLRNNVLISAFGQPVHLDHMTVTDDLLAITS